MLEEGTALVENVSEVSTFAFNTASRGSVHVVNLRDTDFGVVVSRGLEKF
jgi:hypothetical protein